MFPFAIFRLKFIGLLCWEIGISIPTISVELLGWGAFFRRTPASTVLCYSKKMPMRFA